MNILIYPTINLFIYDLRNGLGQNSEEITKNRQRFQSKLPASVGESLFQLDTELETEYTELLGNKREEKNKPIEKLACSDENYEGYYYPVRLGDIYGLLLNCSVKNKTTLYSVHDFKKIKTQIDTILLDKPVTIGQTWMLSASVANFQRAKGYESIAKECYQAFMTNGNWEKDFKGQGCLCGGMIFELWQHRLKLKDGTDSGSSEYLFQPSNQNIQEDYHIIIALYPDTDTAQKAAKFDDSWMRLFGYRHKILFASGQSRYLKQQLKKDFVAIQEGIEGISDIAQASSQKLELSELRQILSKAQKTLSTYPINLIHFDFQIRNINLNLNNYKKRLDTLQEKADFSNFIFFEGFIKYIENKDLIQLQSDYDNLKPGLELLEGLMKSITFLRSIIEIDQQQRERRFQNNIAIVGVGVGSASVVATTSSNSIEAIKKLKPVKKYLDWLQLSKTSESTVGTNQESSQTTPIDNVVVATTFSIFVGIAFGVLTKLIIEIGETWRHFCRHHYRK